MAIQVLNRPIDLMIIGAQKTGTTSLLRYLGQHPEILTHIQSEMTYFIQEYGKDYQEIFFKYFSNGNPQGKIILAKHVYVMYCPEAIHRLGAHNPRMQVLLMLRNPVQRAYSAYWYARRMGWETASTFSDALRMEEARLREGWQKWRQCAYIYNGKYYPHVKRLFDKFAKEQIHIFLSDDLKEDPSKVCRQIFTLFPINPDLIPEIEKKHNIATQARSETMARVLAWTINPDNPLRNKLKRLFSIICPSHLHFSFRQFLMEINKKPFSPPPMDLGTQLSLIEIYHEDNERLGKLIGRNLSHWSLTNA
jgi:hypothetical protein